MRIGINVPNELLQQVRELRPKVNISEVCREALRHHVEVSKMAHRQVEYDNMIEQVARLDELTPKPMVGPDWVALALDDARDWISAATPEIWNKFIAQSDYLRRQGRHELEMVDLWSQMGGGKGFWNRYDANGDWVLNQLEIQMETGVHFNIIEKVKKEYCPAWLSYVNEVRRLLEKRRKDEYDRIMADRAAALKSRPAPKLPKQLV